MALETLSEHACYRGTVGFYRHRSQVNDCDMRFAVFVPSQAASGRVPVLTWLAGLTCTEETFMIKAGAQRVADELGLMLVSPDTSPRGENVPDDPDGAYDLGLGAGFYLNATEEPWSRHYRMYDYLTGELPEILFSEFPGDPACQGVFGHSMGGHGALILGLKNPRMFRSISAFAPISNPVNCPWGQKAFTNYLGRDKSRWREYDATELVRSGEVSKPRHPILVDQGLADPYLGEQLHPEALEAACRDNGIELRLRRHERYDHGYYFISTFMEDHLRFHAGILCR